MIQAGAFVALFALAACHDVVAPKACTAVMTRGLHQDTTVMTCRY